MNSRERVTYSQPAREGRRQKSGYALSIHDSKKEVVMKKIRILLPVFVLVSAMCISACGGSSQSSSSPTATTKVSPTAVSTPSPTPPFRTLLANDSKSRDGKNMIRWGERTAERVQVHQEKQKKEDFHVDVSPGNWTHPGGNDARGSCGLSQRVTGDAAAR